jgi:hypothetical protein
VSNTVADEVADVDGTGSDANVSIATTSVLLDTLAVSADICGGVETALIIDGRRLTAPGKYTPVCSANC